MSDDVRKKAVEMLLKGATLLAEPCPYCHGVRVMKDGHALCITCGKEPESPAKGAEQKPAGTTNPVLETLNKKLETLTKELEAEKDHEKQKQILGSINALIETIRKLN